MSALQSSALLSFRCFSFAMGVFILPIRVKSNDLFSPLDSSCLVVPPCFITFSHCVAIYYMQTFLHL